MFVPLITSHFSVYASFGCKFKGRQSTLANKKTCSRERESESKAYVRTEEAMNHQQTYSANNSIKSLSIPWSQFLAWFMAAHLSLCIFHTPNLAHKPPCRFLCPLVSSENDSLPCSSFFQLNCRHMFLKKKKKGFNAIINFVLLLIWSQN